MKSLIFITTYNCNMNCEFCLFTLKDREQLSIDVSLFKKLLKEAKNLGYGNIVLTGGEPCLHPRFNELVELTVDKGLRFSIVSNGFLSERYIPLLAHKANFGFIAFSLDSADKEIHDRLRMPGSYEKTVGAVSYFSNHGVITRVQSCLNRFNISEIESLAEVAQKTGATGLRFLSVIATGKNDRFVLSNKEREEAYYKIKAIKKKFTIKLSASSSLYIGYERDFCSSLNLADLAIHPNGDAVFCCDIKKGGVLGNLGKDSLADILSKGRIAVSSLSEKRKECIDKNNFFEGFNNCYFCNSQIGEVKL
ncbi:MAG: radical SAM protein [Nitrospirae bacterium]|nr:radical SAM protein [Nitrospirota bacterium]